MSFVETICELVKFQMDNPPKRSLVVKVLHQTILRYHLTPRLPICLNVGQSLNLTWFYHHYVKDKNYFTIPKELLADMSQSLTVNMLAHHWGCSIDQIEISSIVLHKRSNGDTTRFDFMFNYTNFAADPEAQKQSLYLSEVYNCEDA